MTTVRSENPADHEQVRRLNLAAFESAEEADIVDSLRLQADPIVSLVAVQDEQVVGHIMFSPMTLERSRELFLMGLGPMAVDPPRQRSGIGSRLVSAGLEQCRQLEVVAVIVVGHAAYYPRFGFAPASGLGLQCSFEVPDDVFMALELVPGAVSLPPGTVRFHPAFGGV